MIRPIPIMPVHIGTASLWATVSAHFIVFGIFLLAVWILCKKAVKENEPTPHLPFCLSMAVGLILLLVFGVTITTVKGMILALLLLYASLSDLKTRRVSDCVSIMIFILSLVGFEAANLPSMLIGAMIVFIPQFALAIIRPSRACGGADLKISTALAFMLGAGKGVFALIVGMLLAVIVMAIYNKVNAKDQKEAFPLVPFLSIGAMLVGCNSSATGTTALVDTGDVHALMIGAAGVGKTAYFLYPNLEYACASGMSFITSDTKGDLYRHYGKIAKEHYGYNVAVIDLRNPTKSDGNNLLHLVNKYMDLWKAEPDNLAYKAKAEKYAKIISKTIIMSGMDGASFGQNAFFYDAAEGLLTASILMVAEFCPPETRHIVSVFKIIQDLLAPSGTRGKTQFQLLVSRLPEEHKARWFAGAALNTSEQAMSSVMSTALSRLNAFLDSELEQILCFDTAIDAEKFCSTKSAIFIVLPEEDTSKHFMVSLIVQQMYREILAVADENDGRLKNRVMMYLDEFGTIPKIEGAEMMFSASRSRRVSIVAIIQSFAQLQKNYGKEGCEIITDNTQLTVFGGFAPNSESAQVLSKALGSRTVQSGSVNRGKNDPSQSLQMIERALLTPDELKSLPKGTFVVMKTGFHPMQVKLKLFFKWGIVFPKEIYAVADKGNRKVSYANKSNLEDTIVMLYSTQSVGDKMTEEERATHRPGPDRRNRTDMAFSPRKPGRKPKTETDDDDAEKGDSMPMSQSNIPAGEETEIIINEKGDIVDERIRNDLPR